MIFDKSKVLTAVTAEKAVVGRLGWFAHTLRGLRSTVDKYEPAKLAHVRGEGKGYRFRCEDGLDWLLFYPAPYEKQQEIWVKENELKPGDRIRVVGTWKQGDRGFTYSQNIFAAGEHVVKQIHKDGIEVECEGVAVPYFAIKKIIEPAYRPFKNAEEFLPHEGRLLFDGEDYGRAVHFNEHGVTIMWDESGDFTYYSELLSKGYVWADTKEPVGVKV